MKFQPQKQRVFFAFSLLFISATEFLDMEGFFRKLLGFIFAFCFIQSFECLSVEGKNSCHFPALFFRLQSCLPFTVFSEGYDINRCSYDKSPKNWLEWVPNLLRQIFQKFENFCAKAENSFNETWSHNCMLATVHSLSKPHITARCFVLAEEIINEDKLSFICLRSITLHALDDCHLGISHSVNMKYFT